MSSELRQKLSKGCKLQQERMMQEAATVIDEKFKNTSDFWQCHQCRKITYDMLNGTFIHGDTFNIDKHLQPLLLAGYYTIFPEQKRTNKELTKAQVRKKGKLLSCWRFIFLNSCHAIRDRKEAISLSLDETHYKKGAIYHSRYWNYGELQSVVDRACSSGFFRKYTGQQGNVSFISRLQITSKFNELIEGYVLKNQKVNGGDLPDHFTAHDTIQAIPLPRPERMPVVIKIKKGLYKVPSQSSNDVNAMCKRVEAYNQFMRKQEILININVSSTARKHLEELLYALSRCEIVNQPPSINNYFLNQSRNINKPHPTHTQYTHTPTNDPLKNSVLFNDCNEIFYLSIAFRFVRYNCQRIFTKDMKNGGRSYGIVVQQLPKNIRKQITINGEPVVELDYAAIHPSLLYSQIGIQPPDDIYVYRKGEETQARALIKTIGLVGFNAASEKEAINAVRKEYHDKHGIMLKNDVIKPALELFFDHNPELKQFLGKGVGRKLQFVDSQIMDNILTTLRKQNIPAIPVHDSVIVPASAQEKVHDVMVTAYQKVTRTDHIPWISS